MAFYLCFTVVFLIPVSASPLGLVSFIWVRDSLSCDFLIGICEQQTTLDMLYTNTQAHASCRFSKTHASCREFSVMAHKDRYTFIQSSFLVWVEPSIVDFVVSFLIIRIHLLTGHRQDVGIECHSHDTLLANQIYWKGVHFSTSIKPPSLQYVQIEDAYKAIKGDEFLPNLYHVAIKRSVYGIISETLNSPLTINESSVMDNLIAGIRIKSGLVPTTIENTKVVNTTYGDGLSYSGTLRDPVEFCSVDTNNITFPITLQASGKSNIRTNCTKVREVRCKAICLPHSLSSSLSHP